MRRLAKRPVVLAVAACVITALASIHASQSAGSAAIGGVVIDDSGAPVGGASLTLYDKASPGTPLRAATTSRDGRWAVGELAAGRYGLVVTKDGHAVTDVTVPEALPLAEGQHRDLTLRLVRTGVISGVVIDQFEQPVPGTSVYTSTLPADPAGRTIRPGVSATTNSRGEFRLHGLAPGTYAVRAQPARSHLAAVRDPGSDLVAFFSTFAPGTVDIRQATPFVVQPGAETTGPTIRLAPVPVGSVTIDVIDTTGSDISNAFAEWTPVGAPRESSLRAGGDTSRDANGRLVLDGIPAGHHTISVRATLASQRGQMPPLPLWGSTEFATTAGEQTVSIALQPGSTIALRVAFDGGAGVTAMLRLQARLVTISSAFSDRANGWIRSGTVPFGLEMRGVPPGEYGLEFPGLPGTIAPLSAMLEGRDVLDTPLRVFPGRDIEGLVVTLTDRLPSVSGTLATPDGAPRFDSAIVAFPADTALRTVGSRRIVRTTPDIDGHFEIRDLPPGGYFIAAIEPGWDPALEPERLATLEGTAAQVALAIGQEASVLLSQPHGR